MISEIGSLTFVLMGLNKVQDYEVITITAFGNYTFLTKANNGKEALRNLLETSSDFNTLINKEESEKMTITVLKV
jgi:hypothetical protein